MSTQTKHSELTVTQPKSLPTTSLLQGEWAPSWITAISRWRATPLYHLVGYLGAVLRKLNYDGDSTFLCGMLTR